MLERWVLCGFARVLGWSARAREGLASLHTRFSKLEFNAEHTGDQSVAFLLEWEVRNRALL